MKMFISALFFLCIAVAASSQTSLRLTKIKIQYWNDYLSKWSGWPNDWSYYEYDAQPIIRLTKLDNEGYRFQIESWINGEYNSFSVSYNGYDSKNNWYEYTDTAGDMVAIKGSTLSNLSLYGWPDNLVQIYFWLYSADIAIVME